MSDEAPLTVFQCGPPRDHKCDDAGPILCGGEDADGNFWQKTDSPENRKGASWGSVSCSICGRTAMEVGMWSEW